MNIDHPTRFLSPSADITDELQAAIDTAPVRVVLEPGRYGCGGIRLRSDVELHLSEGAELCFHTDYDAYASTEVAVTAEDSNRAMIAAKGAERLSITGAGRILCNGATGFTVGEDHDMGVRIPAKLRPRVMVLDGCRDVTLTNFGIEDSPMWTVHLVDCDGLTISGLRIDNDRRMPNTDGIVIDACRNVDIQKCEIRTADDGVVLKTSARDDGSPSGACEDVHVHDLVIESHSCALKLGTESHGDFRRICFEQVRIEKSNRALGIFSRDGGVVEDVRFSNIDVDCHETPDGFWGSGEALTITVLDRVQGVAAGAVTGVTVSGLTGQMEGGISLYAETSGQLRDVQLSDINLTQKPGPLGTGCKYDIRPTPADLLPSEDAGGRKNAWRIGEDGKVIGLIDYPGGMPGLFAKGAAGISIENVDIVRPDPLPTGWHSEVIVLDETA